MFRVVLRAVVHSLQRSMFGGGALVLRFRDFSSWTPALDQETERFSSPDGQEVSALALEQENIC